MVNLLNMQNGLKQNYSDHDITETLFGFEFLQDLIKEHLGMRKEGAKSEPGRILKRDPSKTNRKDKIYF